MSEENKENTEEQITFNDLNLKDSVLQALNDVGYEVPSPIQAQTIPHLIEGRDVVGQAQTGTGKTAAFALPLLCKLEKGIKTPQVLVLAPTRELALQVSEAFERYSSHMDHVNILAIYGGQSYVPQLRELKRGVEIVVGTPGRVMDHIKKGTLQLDNLKALVLDEADEMLQMGFIDDVEWILEQTPDTRQIALFSATMPPRIRDIAQRHLKDPIQISIKQKTTTAETINQRFWLTKRRSKFDGLQRILEVEDFTAVIIFVRTKIETVELADKLQAYGFSAAPLNGDIAQNNRERTIDHLKKGKIDILVATDVAARGLDVERISHVVNYDAPHDTEAYVHRIGRTGRAGRNGEAILFVGPKDQRILRSIEHMTKRSIQKMELPTADDINQKRVAKFKENIEKAQGASDIQQFKAVLEEYVAEKEADLLTLAASLAHMCHSSKGFFYVEKQDKRERRDSSSEGRRDRGDRGDRRDRGDRGDRRDRGDRGDRRDRGDRGDRRDRGDRGGRSEAEEGMERYRIDVGHAHQVKPSNIVGAIANETGLNSRHIGHIKINTEYSTVDLPSDMPKDVLNKLKKVYVCNEPLNISKASKGGSYSGGDSGGFRGRGGRGNGSRRGGRGNGAGRGPRRGRD